MDEFLLAMINNTSEKKFETIDELLAYYKESTGKEMTRDQLLYEEMFKVKNEDEFLEKILGYNTEKIKEIENEYKEYEKTIIAIPERYLEKKYKIVYPDGSIDNIKGKELNSFKGKYNVNENKDYNIKITENNKNEKNLNISIDKFVKNSKVEDEYYKYEFNFYGQGYNVSVKDKNLESYGKIKESIDNIPIVGMNDTFKNCINLIEAPEIPKNVVSIYSGFYGCEKLKRAPKLPNGLENMTFAFDGCKSMIEAPVIPNTVKEMNCAFWNCENLVQAPDIPSSVEYLEQAFAGCKKLSGKFTINSTHIDTHSTIESEKVGHQVLMNAGINGTGLKVIIPNDDVRTLIMQHSQYNANKVQIVKSE